MLTTKTLSAVIATVAMLSINAYAAPSQDNPLHPAYYAERVTTEFAVGSAERYVDAANPLHPAYNKPGMATEWIATGAGTNERYGDARNPLHPAFKRF